MKIRRILLASLITIFTFILCGCGRSYHIKGRVIVLSELQSSAGFIVEFTGKELPQGGVPINGVKVTLFHELNNEDKPVRKSVWQRDTDTDGNGFFEINDYATPSSESKVGLEVSKKGYKTVYTTYIDYSDIEPQEFLVVLVPETESGKSFSPNKPSAVTPAIRSVDFLNFTYQWTEDLIDPKNPERTFALKNGKLPETRNKEGLVDEMGVFFREVVYGDVTGDDQEEAIISMSILTGGSATPNIVYVYSLQNNRVKPLWGFTTGDRADKGLRNVYAENGNLIVELNSPVDSKGDCCPVFFTRSKYKWSGTKFQTLGSIETLPIPQ